MVTKLTLKLKETVIKRAKKYAATKKLSLSRLIENYLHLVTLEQNDEFEISPFVKSISTGKNIPIDIDNKRATKEYTDFLDKKYK
ncbi:DUF6364 family protein [Niabella ginsengisoli]|uniref:DUF6364 family protein n=1 Tax=Niabella ginsengisoli TaxID=522298 RepID=A0ABS9SF48_9BACT|nr:DUF6364 family protein [Niabella ginsengisoli]MCH5596983.1 DUF6364 family protein [Niabella ginsengisoli]